MLLLLYDKEFIVKFAVVFDKKANNTSDIEMRNKLQVICKFFPVRPGLHMLATDRQIITLYVFLLAALSAEPLYPCVGLIRM